MARVIQGEKQPDQSQKLLESKLYHWHVFGHAFLVLDADFQIL